MSKLLMRWWYKGRTSLKQYMPKKPIRGGARRGAELTPPMVTCVNLTFTQVNPHNESNMAWDTQRSQGFVNMFKATGTQFSVTISLPPTGLLRNCISTKYYVVGLCDQAKKSSLHAYRIKQQSKEWRGVTWCGGYSVGFNMDGQEGSPCNWHLHPSPCTETSWGELQTTEWHHCENTFHLTTHTWVVRIKMTRWSPTTPFQWLERNGGAESSMI